MNLSQISEKLDQLFHQEDNRLVFWNDANGDFKEQVDSLPLDGVTLIRVDQEAALALKARLELDDPAGKYLLYSPAPEPSFEEDWLLDIRLYSRSFYADRSSMLLNELGLTHQSMRGHLASREAFFKNKERVERLKKLVEPDDLASQVDLKILAVLVRAEQPELFQVLLKLLADWGDKSGDLGEAPAGWADIEKYRLAEFFWGQIAQKFGYDNENPSLENWILHMLVTDLAWNLRSLPPALSAFVIDGRPVNVSVFLGQWRANAQFAGAYSRIANLVAQKLNLEERLADFNAEQLQAAFTFEEVEQRMLASLRDAVRTAAPGGWDEIAAATQRRRDGFWCQTYASDRAEAYTAAYYALDAASELFKLRQTYGDGFSYLTAEAMFEAYQTELYRFDQSYRCFNVHADDAEAHNWDVLKELRDKVEDCYSVWYMERLSTTWGALATGTDGNLRKPWRLEGVDRQQDFFMRHVEPQAGGSKVFVIISDAFRYEAAEELTRELNGKYRFQASLKTQLGVLPSYTALGMAALLPHKSLSYKLTANAEVLVDDQPTVSLEQRSAILGAYKGVAVRAGDILDMSRDEGRQLVRPYQIVYIYHDHIDATGDKRATEEETFQAVRKTIEQLSTLVRKVINMLNGSHVIITADHGFLFQRTEPTQLEKSALDVKPAGVLKPKKRFILGSQLGDDSRVWHGDTKDSAGAEGGMEYWLPKGVNRFHFVGGARFIHGGAMLQEIAVPLIVVKEKEGAAAVKTAVKSVEVTLLTPTASLKVVNNVQRFDFLQTEGVSERRPARVLLVALRDANHKLVSDEVRLTFDSTSDMLDERKRSATLTLLSGEYNKRETYYLVLTDAKDGIEYGRYALHIDLAFKNEF